MNDDDDEAEPPTGHVWALFFAVGSVSVLILLSLAIGTAYSAQPKPRPPPIVIPWERPGSTKAEFDRDGKDCYEYALKTRNLPRSNS